MDDYIFLAADKKDDSMLMTYWQPRQSDGTGTAANETKHETHEYQIFNEQCISMERLNGKDGFQKC